MSESLTVGELVDLLKDLDRDLPVILAVDPEGNDYWRAQNVDSAMAAFGDGIEIHATREEVDTAMVMEPSHGYTEEDYPPDSAVPCVVLWP